MFSYGPELLVAISVCLGLHALTTEFRARQSFPLLRVKCKFCLDPQSILMDAVLIGLIAFLAMGGTGIGLMELAGLLIAAGLLYKHLVHCLQFREHGMVIGSSFVPYVNISSYDWRSLQGNRELLTLRGRWYLPKHATICASKMQLAEGIIAGASRLERVTRRRVFWLTLGRICCWGTLFILAWWLLSLLNAGQA